MTISVTPLLKGTAWTVGAFGVGQVLRFVTNVVLARLLAPELFGIMLIVNSLKIGITLFADLGIGQSIVYNKNANIPDFYDTAWSVDLLRNLACCLVCFAAAIPVAHVYESPILAWVLPISGVTFLFTGFSSVGRFLLQKRMEIGKLTIFEMAVVFTSSVAMILFAYFSPTIWALVLGGLFGSAVSMVSSHFLLPDVKPRFFISRHWLSEILTFGKWVFISSVVYFLALNYDRLYLPTLFPLDLVGVYAVARSMSDLLSALTTRVGSGVLFPFMASHAHMHRAELRHLVAPIRARLMLAAALAIAALVATVDLVIGALYDERYLAAGWMLPVLMFGSWFSILATVNDAALVGLGKPSYTALSNTVKFAFLAIGLPLGFAAAGASGVVLIIALADLCRYAPVFVGLRRERLSFGFQDVSLTLAMFTFIVVIEWLRWFMGLGTSFDTLPLDMGMLGGSE
jgi:O-antigen/teichoic acid export membrane protein